jgi:hypothetical protein
MIVFEVTKTKNKVKFFGLVSLKFYHFTIFLKTKIFSQIRQLQAS